MSKTSRRQDRPSNPEREDRRSNDRMYNPVVPDPLRELMIRSNSQPRGVRRPKNTATSTMPSVHSWEADGVDHINFCSGTSPLSTLLGERNGLGFNYPMAGHFKTLLGFNYFLKSNNDDDFFRDAAPTRFRGRVRDQAQRHLASGIAIYLHAVWVKLQQYPDLANALRDCELPLDFYYIRNDEDTQTSTRVRPTGYDWQIAGMNYIRDHLREGTEPTFFEFLRKETRERLDLSQINAAPQEERAEVRHGLELDLLNEQIMHRFGHMQHALVRKPKEPRKDKKPKESRSERAPADTQPPEDFRPRFSQPPRQAVGPSDAQEMAQVRLEELPLDGGAEGPNDTSAEVALQSSADVAEVLPDVDPSNVDHVWVDRGASASLEVVQPPVDASPASSEPQA